MSTLDRVQTLVVQTSSNALTLKHFNIECWDITVNSLSVRVVHRLLQYLKAEFPDTQINIRPHMEIVHCIYGDCPSGYRKDILDWFIKHKDIAWGSDYQLVNLKTEIKIGTLIIQ